VLVAAMLLLADCGGDGAPAARRAAAAESSLPPVAVADPGTVATFEVALAGAAEVPGPGDPDGSGEAAVMLAPGRGEVCVTLAVRDLEPTGAHLHEAPAGQSGPAVLALPLGEGCASADQQLLVRLAKAPAGFYVNVFSAEFPEGAVRGQLGLVAPG
jgi:hypothetical protein